MDRITIDTQLNASGVTRGADVIQKEMDKIIAKQEKLQARMDRFLATGGSRESRAFQGMRYDADMLNTQMFDLQDEMARINQTNVATNPTQQINAMSSACQQGSSAVARLGQSASESGNNFKKALKTILKYGFGIRSVYILVRKFRQALIESFKNLATYDKDTNNALSNITSSLKALKGSLATAFSPILTMVEPAITKFIDMLASAVQWIAELMSALAGKNTYTVAVRQQTDYAKSLEKTAKAGQKASKSLAGFDELNNITTNDSSSSSAGLGYSYETKEVSSGMVDLAEKLKELKPLIEAIGIAFATWKVIEMVSNLGKLGSAMGVLGDALVIGATAIGGFYVGNKVYELITGEKVDMSMWQQLKTIWSSFGDDTWMDATSMWWDDISGGISAWWHDAGFDDGSWIGAVWMAIKDFGVMLWDLIKNWYGMIWDITKTIWGAILGWLWSAIVWLCKLLVNIVKAVFVGIYKIIVGWYSIIWGITKTLWTGIWNFFESLFKGICNLFISVINFVIESINKISFDLPDVMGGYHIGFDIPTIPKLATGTVVPRSASQFMAILGDNNKETEVVSPLSTMKQAMLEAMAENGAGNNGDIVVQIDGREVFRAVRNNARTYQKSTGTNAFSF